MVEKCKPCEIYRKMCDVYKWATLFKEGRNSIQDEVERDRSRKESTCEPVDLDNALFLTDRRVLIGDISQQVGISMARAFKIVHDDLIFSKVSCL